MTRRALDATLAETLMSLRRIVAVVDLPRAGWPVAVPAPRVRLNAITASTSQAAFAVNFPEGQVREGGALQVGVDLFDDRVVPVDLAVPRRRARPGPPPQGRRPGPPPQGRRPVRPIVDNDVSWALLAEREHGVAAGVDDVIHLYLDEGMGAAMWSGGRPLHGARGLAGEIAHSRTSVPARGRHRGTNRATSGTLMDCVESLGYLREGTKAIDLELLLDAVTAAIGDAEGVQATVAVARVIENAPLVGARIAALGELLQTWSPEPNAVPR